MEVVPGPSPLAVVPALSADDRLVELWLGARARSPRSKAAYRTQYARFRAFSQVPLARLDLGTLQDYAADLEHRPLAPATRRLALAALKSLLGFGHRIGVLAADVGRALPVPGDRDTLAERILDEGPVQDLLRAAKPGRDRALVELLYVGGVRISEALGLRWRDLKPRGDGGQITVFGKGSKTRAILLPGPTYRRLAGLRGRRELADAPVFKGRGNRALSRMQAWRIVKAAAATVEPAASPHWLRHAHATHALDAGVAIHLVKDTLGHASIETTSHYLHAKPTTSSALALKAPD